MSGTYRNRGSMTQQRGGSGPRGDLPPMENVVVMVKGYDPEMIKSRKSNPDKDYMDVLLVHDVPGMGLKAEFDAEGNPTTEMRVKMPMPKNGGERRRDILGLSQKKSGGAPMTPGSLVVLEKAWLDRRENTIKAHYSHGGPTQEDQQNGLKSLFSHVYVCVMPERDFADKDDKSKRVWSGRQDVYIADQFGAEEVTAGTIGQAVERLVANTAMGAPGFQLHARRVVADAPPDASPEQKAEVARRQAEVAADPNNRIGGFIAARNNRVEAPNGEVSWVPQTPAEILDRFWNANEANQEIKRLMETPGAEADWQFEFVPMICLGQAKSLVPSKNSGPNDKMRDNSKLYRIFDEVSPEMRPAVDVGLNGERVEVPKATQPDGRVIGVADAGWMLSHAAVERPSAEEGAPYYATYQNAVTTRPLVYTLPDIPTPNMPDYHKKAVEAEARRLAENKNAYYQVTKAPKAEAAEAAEPDEGSPAPGR